VNTFQPAGETLVEQGKEGQTTKRACNGVFPAVATDGNDGDMMIFGNRLCLWMLCLKRN